MKLHLNQSQIILTRLLLVVFLLESCYNTNLPVEPKPEESEKDKSTLMATQPKEEMQLAFEVHQAGPNGALEEADSLIPNPIQDNNISDFTTYEQTGVARTSQKFLIIDNQASKQKPAQVNVPSNSSKVLAAKSLLIKPSSQNNSKIHYIAIKSLSESRQTAVSKKKQSGSPSCLELVSRKFVTRTGYVVRLYQEENTLQAVVKEIIPGGFKSEPLILPVYLAIDMNLERIARLNAVEQKNLIHVYLPQNSHSGYVYVGSGLKGGGLEGDEEKEKEYEKELQIEKLKITDLEELRSYFHEDYLEVTPENCEQLFELSEDMQPLLHAYDGNIFVKGWEEKGWKASEHFEILLDMLRCFRNIKKFQVSYKGKKGAKLISKLVQYYWGLVELNVSGCGLSDVDMQKIIESVPFPEKLQVVDIRSNALTPAMYAAVKKKFLNAQIRHRISQEENKVDKQQSREEELLSKLIVQAEQGDVVSQNNLAARYARGREIAKNLPEALKWFERAASQGSKSAQVNAGMMYKNGWGTQQDYPQALGWFRKAAEQGSADAQNNLGIMYKNGWGVGKDDAIALDWFEKAVEQGHVGAGKHVALLDQNIKQSRRENNQEKDILVAKQVENKEQIQGGEYQKVLFEETLARAQEGVVSAQNEVGIMYQNGQGIEQDWCKAVVWYQTAARQGFAAAQARLGDMCYYGKGIEVDYQEAIKWYRKAAEQENIFAQNSIGFMYDHGRGVVQNYQEAISWYRRAAVQGDTNAQYKLGFIYQNGEGVIRDYKEATKWYQKAADQNDVDAQYKLGSLYEQGEVVEKDEEKAVKWYIKANNQQHQYAAHKIIEFALRGVKLAQIWLIEEADKKNEEIQYALGKLYEQGRGVKKDEEKAVEWYIRAVNQRNHAAYYALKKLILKGNKLAQEWLIERVEKGDEVAQDIAFQIGNHYEEGAGVEKDEEKSAEWYIRAVNQRNHAAYYAVKDLVLKDGKLAQEWLIERVEKGDEVAQDIVLQIGHHYEKGEDIEKDEGKAVEWYIRAVSQEKTKNCALVILGKLALKGVKLAQDWLLDKADREHKEVQYFLGSLYEDGIRVVKDKNAAACWYIKAAKQGYPSAVDAMIVLALQEINCARDWIIEYGENAPWIFFKSGKLYEEGIKVEKDEKKAVEFYIKASNQEYREAYDALQMLVMKSASARGFVVEKKYQDAASMFYEIGGMYLSGKSNLFTDYESTPVRENLEKAVEWYIKAAEQNHLGAFDSLCKLAEHNKVQEWLRAQAEMGNREAQYSLGVIYMRGAGIQENPQKAAEWYIKAAEQGHQDADAALEDLALQKVKIAEEWVLTKGNQVLEKSVLLG